VGIQGLVAAAAKREEELANAPGGFLPELRLQANERAHVRFLGTGTEEDDEYGKANLFGIGKVHQIMQISKKGSKYNIDKYCTMEDNGECEWCDQVGETENVSKAVNRIAGWIWVQDIWHEHANPKRPDEEDGEPWVVAKTKVGKTFYVENVERILLFRKGYGGKGYLLNFLMTHLEHYGTLADREYEIQRQGKGMLDTSYSITPIGEASELDPDVATLASELPGIEFVLQGKVRHDNETDSYEVSETGTAAPREEVVTAPAPVAKPRAKSKLAKATAENEAPKNVAASKPAVSSQSALERLKARGGSIGRSGPPVTATPPDGYRDLADDDNDDLP
jgi:hypothetical protein